MTTQTLSASSSDAPTSSPDTLSAKPGNTPISVESVRQGGRGYFKPNKTMNELFPIPESKSPRMKWMERHHLTVKDCGDGISISKITKRYEAIHGMKTIGYGATPDAALVAAAKSLNIRLWNEQ